MSNFSKFCGYCQQQQCICPASTTSDSTVIDEDWRKKLGVYRCGSADAYEKLVDTLTAELEKVRGENESLVRTFLEQDKAVLAAKTLGEYLKLENERLKGELEDTKGKLTSQIFVSNEAKKDAEFYCNQRDEVQREAIRVIDREIENLKVTTQLRSENAQLRERVREMLPIVEAAYWDEHTAGVIPGSGYNNKAQQLAGDKWDWRKSDKFKAWLAKLKPAEGESK